MGSFCFPSAAVVAAGPEVGIAVLPSTEAMGRLARGLVT